MLDRQAFDEPLHGQHIIAAPGVHPMLVLHRQIDGITAHDDKGLGEQKFLIHRDARRRAGPLPHEGGIQLILDHHRAFAAIDGLLAFPTVVRADQPENHPQRNGDPISAAQGAMDRHHQSLGARLFLAVGR